MARATQSDLQTLLGDLGGYASDLLDAVLELARREVGRDGIMESNESFSDMQIYLAAHLLEKQGKLTGALQSKSIGDVSISFQQNTNTNSNESWLDRYHSLKNKILGPARRFA